MTSLSFDRYLTLMNTANAVLAVRVSIGISLCLAIICGTRVSTSPPIVSTNSTENRSDRVLSNYFLLFFILFYFFILFPINYSGLSSNIKQLCIICWSNSNTDPSLSLSLFSPCRALSSQLCGRHSSQSHLIGRIAVDRQQPTRPTKAAPIATIIDH